MEPADAAAVKTPFRRARAPPLLSKPPADSDAAATPALLAALLHPDMDTWHPLLLTPED
jgi:hypothetical protein